MRRVVADRNGARRWGMGVAILVGLLVALSASAAIAQEMELGGKLRSGEQVVISAGEVVEGDLYATAGLVRVEGVVTGDLLALGGQIEVLGEVRGDLMAAGGTIDVSGPVAGDIRTAGGQLDLSGPIGEDLFVAGGQVTLASSADIGEDLVFGVGQMVLDGRVAGDVLGTAGDYTRRGTIGGTENVTIAQPEERVPTPASRAVAAMQRYVSILALAALVLWLAPRVIQEPADTLRRRPLASLGLGILTLAGFVVVVGIAILAMVLLAILFGLIGLGDLVAAIVFTTIVVLIVMSFLLYLALAFGAPSAVGIALGDLVLTTDASTRRWLSLVLGLLVVVALTSVPVVGGWLTFFVLTFGLGAILLALFPRGARQDRPLPEPEATPGL